MRRLLLAAAAALVVFPMTPAQAATVAVSMKGLDFVPPIVTAAIGDTVKWSNSATDRHSSTSGGPTPWDSGALRPWGGQFSRVFPFAGAFPYYCTIHRAVNMTGTIKVATRVSPNSGTTTTGFVVALAKSGTKPPAGFAFVVQRARGTGAFSTIAKTTAATVTVRVPSPGSYKLRAGLQKTNAPVNNAWFGDPVPVTVR